MNRAEFHRLLLPLLAFAVALTLAPAILLNALSGATGTEIKNQAVARQAAAVGGDLAANLQRAKSIGFPLAHIPGLSEHFQQLLERFPDFRFFALLDREGKLLHLRGITPERFETILELTDAAMQAGPRAARGEAAPVVSRIGDLSVTRMYLAGPTQAADGGQLLFGVHAEPVSTYITQALGTLAASMSMLLLLVLPFLHAVARQSLLLPVERLATLFRQAAKGRFQAAASPSATSQLGRIERLWNNEVFSLQERQLQLHSFAREAIAAADETEVAAEIERLARKPDDFSIAASDDAQAAAGPDLQTLRLPILALAIVAGSILGNMPDTQNQVAALAGCLAGIVLGGTLAGRSTVFRRTIVLALALAALFMLANAISPLVTDLPSLDTGLTGIAFMLLMFPLAAALAARGDGPARSNGLRSDRRLDKAALLLHLVAGLLAAGAWTFYGPSPQGDTVEVWIGAVMLAAAVGHLWRWRS